MAEVARQQMASAGVDVMFDDLRELDLPLAGSPASWSSAGAATLGEHVCRAGAVIIAAPIYNFDVNAAAKAAVELTGKAWEDKVVGFLCAAGGASSYMSVMGLANSLMLDFRCLILPRFVYASKTSFMEQPDGKVSLDDPSITERIAMLTQQLVRLADAVA